MISPISTPLTIHITKQISQIIKSRLDFRHKVHGKRRSSSVKIEHIKIPASVALGM